MIRSIQNRIIILIISIGICLMAGTLIFNYLDQKRISSLLDGMQKENSGLLIQVVDFKSKSLRDFAVDYTYWDDMVAFTRSLDPSWADDNIRVSLPTFEIDYAWVYSKDLKVIYKASADSVIYRDSMPLSVKEIALLVDTARLYNFFVWSSAGLIEISGGSIHPTDDPDRKTTPNGYLFVGRIWTDELRSELEQFSRTRISVFPASREYVPRDSIDPKNFSFVNNLALEDWNHSTIAGISSSGSITFLKEFKKLSDLSRLILSIALVCLLLGVALILIRMINRPLRYLITSLTLQKNEPIGSLMLEKSEFGRLAQLISDFFVQKTKLEKEIEDRIKVEKELLLAKDRAEESDRLKSAFLNNISHEIRTPMNAIVGFSELVGEKGISESERTEFLGIIKESSHRLLGVITDLINISTIQSGQEIVSESTFNLNSLLYDIYHSIHLEMGNASIVLGLDMALKDEYSEVRSDPSKLTQILMHLLRNALKFTREGRIDFGYLIRTGEIEFFVKDTGIGIPPEKFESIFARFEQADDSISREYGGTGLGLPISKAYVGLLEGQMWLKSEVGKGTVFFFTIPYKSVR